MTTHVVRTTAIFLLVVTAQLSGRTIPASLSETIALGELPVAGYSPGYHAQAFAEFDVPAGSYDSGTIELTIRSTTFVPEPFDIGIYLSSTPFVYGSLPGLGVADISGTTPVFSGVFSAPVSPAFLNLADAGGTIAITSGPYGLDFPNISSGSPVLTLTSASDGLPLPSSVSGGLLLVAVLGIWRGRRRWQIWHR